MADIQYTEAQLQDFHSKYEPLDVPTRNSYYFMSAVGGTTAYLYMPMTVLTLLGSNLKSHDWGGVAVSAVFCGLYGAWAWKSTTSGQSLRMKLAGHRYLDTKTLKPVTGLRFHLYRVVNCAMSYGNFVFRFTKGMVKATVHQMGAENEKNRFNSQFAHYVIQKEADAKIQAVAQEEANNARMSPFLSNFDARMGIVVVAEKKQAKSSNAEQKQAA